MTGLHAVVAVAAFVLTEPVAAAVHRFGHGPGWVLHRSHHRRGGSGVEANDLFPVVLAGVTMVVMALGVAGVRLLLPVGIGVTAYGLSYAAVHDLYIHRRVRVLPERVSWLEPLRRAHDLHHRFGDAPYGMLAPIVPRRVRERAERSGAGAVNAAAVATFRHVGTRARVENTS